MTNEKRKKSKNMFAPTRLMRLNQTLSRDSHASIQKQRVTTFISYCKNIHTSRTGYLECKYKESEICTFTKIDSLLTNRTVASDVKNDVTFCKRNSNLVNLVSIVCNWYYNALNATLLVYMCALD